MAPVVPVIERLEQLGHTAYGRTVAGHGKVFLRTSPRRIDQSIALTGQGPNRLHFVGHGYAGTIVSKAVEVVPERVRHWLLECHVLNDGDRAEMLPDTIEMLRQMAADSADNTFTTFEMWRDVFINDGEP
jgi:hypothetical protein